MTRAAIVGLGKLGACIAASFAYKGFDVTGMDISPQTVQLVNEGEPPVFETGLAEVIRSARARLRATSDYAEAVAKSSVTFIVVPTPSDEDGAFSLRYVAEAARGIGRALRGSVDYHLVVLTSTVLPGATQHCVVPILERESGRQCGRDFGVCYSPEFIALGSVIKDFLNPDFLLIGQSDRRAGDVLTALYGRVCDNEPPVVRMNLVNAELAKLSVNAFVTMKISFANTLAALCERLPEGDVDAVTTALGHDSRIGPRYLKGGIGYGGPCFPRDNRAFSFLASQLGERAFLADATDALNRTIVGRLARHVKARAPRGGKVAVLGMSYKPSSNVVEASQGLELAVDLASEGFNVAVYDPAALDATQSAVGDRITCADSLVSAIQGADVVVVANPDPAFRDLPSDAYVVIDAWRLLRQGGAASYSNYVPLGVGLPAGQPDRSPSKLWHGYVDASAGFAGADVGQ